MLAQWLARFRVEIEAFASSGRLRSLAGLRARLALRCDAEVYTAASLSLQKPGMTPYVPDMRVSPARVFFGTLFLGTM